MLNIRHGDKINGHFRSYHKTASFLVDLEDYIAEAKALLTPRARSASGGGSASGGRSGHGSGSAGRSGSGVVGHSQTVARANGGTGNTEQRTRASRGQRARILLLTDDADMVAMARSHPDIARAADVAIAPASEGKESSSAVLAGRASGRWGSGVEELARIYASLELGGACDVVSARGFQIATQLQRGVVHANYNCHDRPIMTAAPQPAKVLARSNRASRSLSYGERWWPHTNS